jgi:hypothetical protein
VSVNALSWFFRDASERGGRSLFSRGYATLERGFDRIFSGSVRGPIYPALRIGLAAIFLVRHADWLRPWVFLEHHRFVRGLMFANSAGAEPQLLSPMIPGLSLSDASTRLLVYARTLLAVSLLLGVRARASAIGLAFVSYLLLAADRFRYYHHLHLLYVAIAWLALAPIGSSLSLERGFSRLLAWFGGRARPLTQRVWDASNPLWPLQLIRALTISVYLAAGLSKLDWSFLRGDALRQLEQFNVLKGGFWEAVRDLVGYGGVGTLACIAEFALPLLLLLPPTRRAAVLLGFGFHLGISLCMPVYSFGAQMAVLLLAFIPTSAPSLPGRKP